MTHPFVIRRRITAFKVVWLFSAWVISWAAFAHAVDEPLVVNLIDLPWFQALCAVWVTIAGGIAATLERRLKALYSSSPFHGRWEFLKDLAVSIAVGLFCFFIGMSQKAPADMLTASLVAAGYGGTRILSGAVDRLLGAKKPGSPTMTES